MAHKHKLLLAIGLCLVGAMHPQQIEAQNTPQKTTEQTESKIHITGRIVGSKGEPLELATVSILSPKGAVIDGAITTQTGEFDLEINPSLAHSLRIQLLGYKTLVHQLIPNSTGLSLGDLPLQEENKQLKAIEVVGDRGSVRLIGSTLKAKVASSSLADLPTVQSILSQLPFVTMTKEGVTVQGRGTPEIYLGHRKITLDELKEIAPSNIKDIDVMMVPGAEYGASVQAVIKITLKSRIANQLGGSLKTEPSVQRHFSQYYDGTLYWNGDKLSLKAGASYSQFHNNWLEEHPISLTTLDGDHLRAFLKGTKLHGQGKGTDANLNAVYTISPNHEIGTQLRHNQSISYQSIARFDSELFINDVLRELSSSAYTSHPILPNRSTSVDGYYHGKLSKGLQLHLEGMYLRSSSLNNNASSIDYILPRTKSPEQISSDVGSTSHIYSWKGYIRHPLLSGQLSLGTEGSRSIIDQDSRTLSEQYTDLMPTISNTNRQTNLAFFSTWDGQLSQSLGLSLGLRGEMMRIDYTGSEGLVTAYKQNKWYFFPTISLSYGKDQMQMLLTYSMNINRPGYQSLGSGTTYINKFLLMRGNPALMPNITHSIDGMLSWQGFSFQAQVSRAIDAEIMWTERHPTRASVLVITPQNTNYWKMQLGGTWQKQVGKLWRTSISTLIFKDLLQYQGMDLSKPIGYLQWNNVLSLPKAWTISAGLWYRSSGHSRGTYMLNPSGSISLSVGKRIGKRWDISLYTDDLFVTQNGNNLLSTPVGEFYSINKQDGATISLSIRYSFNVKTKTYQGGSAGSAERKRL